MATARLLRRRTSQKCQRNGMQIATERQDVVPPVQDDSPA
jgi:hypothetical protein